MMAGICAPFSPFLGDSSRGQGYEEPHGTFEKCRTEQRLAKLEAVLAQGTNDLSEAVPLLADLLSI
jgi:hypothetical protein